MARVASVRSSTAEVDGTEVTAVYGVDGTRLVVLLEDITTRYE